MAIARLSGQDAKGTSATSSVSATYPGATTSGNLLIASIYAIVGSASVTIPTGFSVAKVQDFSSGAQSVQIVYKIADGTETTITATGTGATNMKIHVYEYSGVDATGAQDGSNGATSGVTNVTTIASGNVTTTNADDLLFIALSTGGSSTAHAFTGGFNKRQSDASAIRLVDADQIVSATGTYSSTPTWTTSLRAGIAYATFKAASTATNNSGFFIVM